MTKTVVDFFKTKEKAKTQEDIEQLAEVLYPCVEHLLDDVLQSYAMNNTLYKKQRELPYVNFTAAITLLFAATQYLNKVAKQKNDFGLDKDTIKEFSHNLLESLFKQDKNREYNKILKGTLNAT